MRTFLFAALATLVACDSSMTETDAPSIGKADSSDRADQDCQVVLRDVGFKPGSPYSTRDGWIVWQGHVDVASDALSAGADVGVLYHRVGRPWYEVDAVPPAIRDPQLPLQHFSFELWYGITSGGEGGTNWQDMKIEVIPFLRMLDGSRVFDHNINESAFDNYVLDYSWGTGRRPFELETDPTACVR